MYFELLLFFSTTKDIPYNIIYINITPKHCVVKYKNLKQFFLFK